MFLLLSFSRGVPDMGFFKVGAGLLAAGGVSYGAYAVLGPDSSDDVITVQNVIDGDTIDVTQDGETTRIRLLNIDTPEMGKECLAEEAKQYLAGLLPVGTVVTLEYDDEREDKYGRTLAGVSKEGSLINASVAEEGFAVPMKVGGNTRFFSEVSAAADRARAAGKGINSAGPECVFGDDGTYRDARSTIDAAQHFQFDDMWNDEQFNGAHVHVSRVADAKKSISALEKSVAEQSDFQKAAFGHKQTELLDELDNDATEIETLLNRKITYASDAREKKHAEEEAAREAAEAAQREAEEAARRAELEAAEAARRAEQEAQQAAPAYQAPAAPAPSNPVDNYTGCRAYGGNYAMTSIDKKGRPYAKIDCTTRVQIG